MAAFSEERLAFVRAALPDVRLTMFLSRLEQFDDPQVQALELSFARAPIETQEQEWTHWEVVDAGYEPIVSSTYLTWNIGMVMVNDMQNGVARRRDRRPAECD